MTRADQTIAVRKDTRQKLQGFKVIEEDTYDNVVNRLMWKKARFMKEITKLKNEIIQLKKDIAKI